MRRLALTAIGRNRPGIVAAASRVLLAHRANVEDSQMTILRGHFTMMLVVSVPEEADVATLRDDLDDIRAELDLEAIHLSPLAELDPAAEPVPTHILTLYGADRGGLAAPARGRGAVRADAGPRGPARPAPDTQAIAPPVEPGPESERVGRDLLDTMRSFPRCVGIAAPQIDELAAIVVVHAEGRRD